MKFPRCNNGTAMHSHRPCWTGINGKVTTFLDETWARSYEPNLKRQSNEWKYLGSLRQKKVRTTQRSVELMFIVACDFDGIILHHAVPPRQMVNSDYYCTFLQHHLRPALRRKRRHLLVNKPTILHDNARSHTVAAVTDLLPCSQWEILEHHRTHPICFHAITISSPK